MRIFALRVVGNIALGGWIHFEVNLNDGACATRVRAPAAATWFDNAIAARRMWEIASMSPSASARAVRDIALGLPGINVEVVSFRNTDEFDPPTTYDEAVEYERLAMKLMQLIEKSKLL